jgi:hypothetical protein
MPEPQTGNHRPHKAHEGMRMARLRGWRDTVGGCWRSPRARRAAAGGIALAAAIASPRSSGLFFRSLLGLLALCAAFDTSLPQSRLFGQAGVGGGGGGVGGGGGGVGGGGGGVGGAAGILIDAEGVLRMQVQPDIGGSLARERRSAALAALPGDLRTRSPLRKVALARLEKELAAAAASGRGIPESLQRLAGLTRVQYVFLYPGESGAGDAAVGEVVLAGPAEGWMTDSTGRVVGVDSGSPTLLLEDLAAALRVFPPGHPADRTIGCSIDPTQEGLAALQSTIQGIGRVNPRFSPADIAGLLRESLGNQQVTVQGVSPATHFAQVLVEADYRMKLVAIGLEPAPVRMSTWIELATTSSVASNSLKRWYFVPDYECVRISEDDLAVELVGRGVQLKAADEVVLPDGRRLSADRSDRASALFTQAFTRKYPEIASRSPVYAQLRNLVDLAVVAAYLQEHDAYGRTGWSAAVLLDEGSYAIEGLHPPRQVAPAVNVIWKGARLLTPIGGGIMAQPRQALDPANLLMDEKGAVAAAREAAMRLPDHRWWWD